MKSQNTIKMAYGLLGLCLTALNCIAQQQPAAETKPEVKPPPKWEGSAALGATLTRGNSETLLFTVNILALRKWDKNEFRTGADAAYGENSSVKSTEMVHGFAQYNRLVSERAYLLARVDATHDAVADIEYRLNLNLGGGYYIIKNQRTQLGVEAGPGIIHEKQGPNENTYMSLRLAERFEHKLTEKSKIWQSVEFLPQVDDFNNYIINAEIGIDTNIYKQFDLRFFIVDTFDNEPAPGRKQNDLKFVTAVAYKF